MKQKTKEVYYCDHCNKHGLVKSAMERHILSCTKNPDNFHPCFTCKHFSQVTEWECLATNEFLQTRSYTLRNTEHKNEHPIVMPKECNLYIPKDWSKDETTYVEDPKFTEQYKKFMEGLPL